MSFKLANIINPFLNVRNQVKNADGEWVDESKPEETLHVVTINHYFSDGDFVVFDEWDKKIIIDSIEYYATDTDNTFPRLNVRKGSTGRTSSNLFVAFNSENTSVWDATGLYLSNHKNSYLDAVKYKEGGELKVLSKKQIVLPSGGRFIFSINGDPGEERVRGLIVYRTVEGG